MKNTLSLTFGLLVCFNSYSQKTLPDLTLSDINGSKVNVKDFGSSGKITVLNFWATWCTPCKKELTNLAELSPQWEKAYNVEIIAVSIDDARNTAKVKSYINGQGWDFKVILDQNQDLKRTLNFQTIPYTVVIDKSGNIAYTHTGYIEGDEYLLEEKLKAMTQK